MSLALIDYITQDTLLGRSRQFAIPLLQIKESLFCELKNLIE